MGSVNGGGFLVQLLCTKGSCIFVPPVSELVTSPSRVPAEMLGNAGFGPPPIPGTPPLQLASPGDPPVETGSATQFVPAPLGGGNVFSGHPPAALDTYTVPP